MSEILSKFGGSTISAPGSTIKKPTTAPKITWGIPTPKTPFDTYVSSQTKTSTPSTAVAPAPITRSSYSTTPPVKTAAVPTAASNTGMAATKPTAAQQTYADRLAGAQSSLQDVQNNLNAYKVDQTKTKSPEEEYKNSAEYKAYLKYMREQQNPTEANNTAKERADAFKVLADVQKRKEEADTEARRRYEELLDQPGMLKAGAEQSAGLDRRRSNQELADLALQESAAARTAGVYEDIYQNEQQSNRPLTIEEATSLGLPFGTTLSDAQKMGIVPKGETETLSTPANSASVTAYADMIGSGQMKIENVPEELRGAVAQAVNLAGPKQTISPYLQERITRNLSSIDDLTSQVSRWNTGMGSLLSAIPGTPAADFKADVNTLAANIAFGELTAMREASKTGGALGAVSEKELMLLESALGSLDRAQSPEQFKQSLNTIKESINRWQSAVNQYGGNTESSAGGEGDPVYEF